MGWTFEKRKRNKTANFIGYNYCVMYYLDKTFDVHFKSHF